MLACGVCNGTDLKIIHRKFKGINDYPLMLGHEAIGEVIETGARVKCFKTGDRVTLPFVEDAIDSISSNWGGYSEYAVVGDKRAAAELGLGVGTPGYNEAYLAQTLVPKEMDPTEAAMLITFREVLVGMRNFGMKANDTAVIFGAGPVGLCFTKFSHLLGLKTIVTLDIVDEKLADAKAAGAHYVFNARTDGLDEKIRRIRPEGFNFVVDAVGSNGIINQAMRYITDTGKICVYGISPVMSMELDWSAAPYNWQLIFHQMPAKREEFDADTQILNWVEAGILKPADFISDVFDFEHILDAFKMVESRGSSKKVIIKYY
ncbi:MAG: zinc-binding dehydrogenase [Clostridiales bacterium]|nr:zinc-binding dehydrogenase [Clostridiales bacterium]